jgi:hypothetical protein
LWWRFAELVNKDCYKSYLRTKSLSGMCFVGEKLATRVWAALITWAFFRVCTQTGNHPWEGRCRSSLGFSQIWL